MSNLPIDQVLRNALALEPSQREGYLDTACGTDTALKHAVKDRLDRGDLPDLAHRETMIGNSSFAGHDPIPDIPNYKIWSVLGRGGMGVVYRADQVPLHRAVALKMLATLGPPTGEQLARFHAEAAALARLRHPNIVEIFDYGEWQARPYFVMELVDGQSLAARIEGIPQVPRFAAHLMMIVARAVQAVHQQGILHRDIKPGNILLQSFSAEDPDKTIDPMTCVTFEGRALAPKITDFGVAKDLLADQKFTVTGTTVGTPQYMAPEQAESEYQALGPATDVYGLGATLYELLTGQPPIRGATPLETLANIATHEPALPSRLQPGVPHDLDVICAKCLEKLPARRYATAQALADDLQCYLEHRPIKARPTSTFTRIARWGSRHPLAAGLAGLSALLACALLVSKIFYNSWLATALAAAKNSAEESRLRLVKLYTLTGIRDVDEGHALNGLLWFSEALNEDKGHAVAERRDRVRIATTYSQAPRLRYLWGGTERLTSVGISPDGARTIVADFGGSVRIWDLGSGSQVGPTLKSKSPFLSLALSKDRRWAAGIDHEGVVRLWNPDKGEVGARTIRDIEPFDRLLFHPDGEVLILHQKDAALRVWDLAGESWRPTPHPAMPGLFASTISPDGQSVAIITRKAEKTVSGQVSESFTARVWPILRDPASALPIPLTGKPRHVAVNNEGSRLATVDDLAPAAVRIWDVKTGKPLQEPVPQPGDPAVLKMVFSPRGDLLLTASADHRGRFWDGQTGALMFVGLPHRSDVLRIAFSTDGKQIATGGVDSQARVWDVARGDPKTPLLQHQGTLLFVAFGLNDKLLLTAEGNALRVWELNTASPPERLPPLKASSFKEAVSPDGRYRVVVNDDVAQVFDASTAKPIGPPLKHASTIRYALFSPNNHLVVTTSEDNTARIWKVATGELLAAPLVHDGDVLFAVFSPDGKQIVTTSEDRTARLWDVATGEPLSPLWIHDEQVVLASFSPDGLQVFTRDKANWLHTWDIRPDARPAEILQLWAQVLSGSHFVEGRSEIPLESAGLFKVWHNLQERLKEN